MYKTYIAIKDNLICLKGQEVTVSEEGEIFKDPGGNYISRTQHMIGFHTCFKEKQSPQFNVGSFVKCIDASGFEKELAINQINRILDKEVMTYSHAIRIDNGSLTRYCTNRFQPATKEEIKQYLLSKAKFKIGQMVSYINDKNHQPHEVLSVTIPADEYRICYLLGNSWFTEDMLEEANEPKLMFGDSEVSFQCNDGYYGVAPKIVYIRCKNQIDSLEKIVEFLFYIRTYGTEINKYPNRKFGTVSLHKVEDISIRRHEFKEYDVSIGCLIGTMTQLIAIVDAGLRMKYKES